MVDIKIKKKVFQKLMHNPGISFNQLWAKEGESNTFSYHLKQLIEENLIEKKLDGYYLTLEGKKIAISLDGSSGELKKQPLISILMVVFNNEGQILLYQRLKEPFFGIYGFPGAKLDFGETVLDCAKRELFEETNLSCDFEEVGLLNYSTYEDKNLAYHHVQFVIKCTNPRGILKEVDREGNFSWASKEDFLSKEQFPDNKYTLEYIEKKKYFRVEMKRYIENNKFKKIEIISEKLFEL